MRDYAKRPKKLQGQAKKSAQSNDTCLLLLFIFFSAFFLIYTLYHFVHTKFFAGQKPVATVIASTQHTASVVVKHNSPVDTIIRKFKQIRHGIVLKKIDQSDATKTATTAHMKKIVTKKTVLISPANNQPKYDFYQLLPKMTVVIPT